MSNNPTILKPITEDKALTLDKLLHDISITQDLRQLEYIKRPFISEVVQLTIDGYDVIAYMKKYRDVLREKNLGEK